MRWVLAILILLPFASAAFAQRLCDQARNSTAVGTINLVERVPAVAGQRVYLCGYMLARTGAGTDLEFELVSGTGLNCSQNAVTILGPMTLPANTVVVNRIPYAAGEKTEIGHALCLRTFGTGQLTSVFYWAQF